MTKKDIDINNQPVRGVRLSVVIPVYNAEATLPRCLDSIISQGAEGVEIICVNDGSKDGSLDVLRQYEQRYPQLVRVIDQRNQGVSAARNAALDVAKGEYVTMVDADDYLFPDVLTPAIEQAYDKHCDIIYFGHADTLRSGGETRRVFPEKLYSQGERLQLLQDVRFYGAAWGKFFKRSIIGDTRYDVKMRLYEDVCFHCDLLAKSKTMFVSSVVLYCYVLNYSNATSKYRGVADFLDLCSYQKKFEDTLDKLLHEEDNVSFAEKNVVYQRLKEKIRENFSFRTMLSFYALYRSNMKGKYKEMKQLLSSADAQFGKGWCLKYHKTGMAGRCGRLMPYPLALHIFLSIVFGAERVKRTITG